MRHRVCIRAVLTCAILLGGFAAPAAARTYLSAPSVDWDGFEPYVRANIVAYLNDSKFQIVIYSGETDRSAVDPYDESVGDFTKALLYQLAVDDRRFHRGISKLGAEFRKRIPSLSSDERDNFRELFWQSLSTAPDILPRVRRALASAQKHGRLRCWVCDTDSSLYPAAIRWTK
jgi:hypothetical protein